MSKLLQHLLIRLILPNIWVTYSVDGYYYQWLFLHMLSLLFRVLCHEWFAQCNISDYVSQHEHLVHKYISHTQSQVTW